ncbi:MAG: threonine synthase [Planctomycetes bacterium B3_Pla]|nr:MAG: threonine synthase [Planctomycetes bacterium B3_Pla]
MFVTHLECCRCGQTYESEQVTNLCRCGSPLLVRYDLEKVKASITKDRLALRKPDLWRYRELLPVKESENIVSLGEGMTPVLHLRRLGAGLGLSNLYMKDEGLLPTGSFKARGAAVGVSRAGELGVEAVAMPTNGNAGGAWSAYCAKAGIKSIIVMPASAPEIHRKECAVAGAQLYLVDGLISDAGGIVARAVAQRGYYDVSTLKEPYRIEGKKTMGLEIAEQFSWQLPDVIVYPTGGGVGIIGIHKALKELQQIGWIGDKLPRLVAVQAEGCAPIVRAWQKKQAESEFWPDAKTVAFGLTVPKALGDFIVLRGLYETEGCGVAVSDEDIIEAVKTLAGEEGLFICPEGAATICAATQLANDGWLKPDETVLLLNTGCGLKYTDTLSVDAPVLKPGDDLPDL